MANTSAKIRLTELVESPVVLYEPVLGVVEKYEVEPVSFDENRLVLLCP